MSDPLNAPAGTAGWTCNICGSRNHIVPTPSDREVPGCCLCQSTIRTRAVMMVLSQELFGVTLPVEHFPELKQIRGIGISDSHDYAERLAARLGYANTFLHQEPRFDVTNVPESEGSQYDFVIASEVLEHVTPPVERAFENLYRILKPDGVLVLTVPFLVGEPMREHFPKLHDYTLARLSDRFVLINRTAEGQVEVYEDLVFHGGPGSTLEMRLFSQDHLLRSLEYAGFSAQIYGDPAPQWGVVFPGPWSLPIAARKNACRSEPAAKWRAVGKALAEQAQRLRELWESADRRVADLEGELRIRAEWARNLDAELVKATERMAELESELAARTGWARELDRQLKERTEWALTLERDVNHHTDLAQRLQKEAADLQTRLEATDEALQKLRNSRLLRVARRLRF